MTSGKPLEKAMREVVREIDCRLAALPDHAQAVRLMTGAYILTSLRFPLRDQLDSIFEGVRVMHQSSVFDKVFDDGRIRNSHRTLLNQGRKLFGEPSARKEAALTAIDDPERLDRMLDAILDLKSWKALLAVK